MEGPQGFPHHWKESLTLWNILEVDYWDIEALADAIYELITYPKLHAFLKEEGLKEVNNIKWEYAGQKVRRIYDRVLYGKN